MKKWFWILLGGLLLARAAGAGWEPDPGNELQLRAAATATRFLDEQPELQRYFDAAYGYAIYPTVTRGGLLFGGGFGRGVVIEAERLAGYTSQWQLTLGAQLGAQRHAQIIFFQDRDALAAFKSAGPEFIGQASAAVAGAGGAVTPGFVSGVAIFNLTRGGLMFEASAGGARYGFVPAD